MSKEGKNFDTTPPLRACDVTEKWSNPLVNIPLTLWHDIQIKSEVSQLIVQTYVHWDFDLKDMTNSIGDKTMHEN